MNLNRQIKHKNVCRNTFRNRLRVPFALGQHLEIMPREQNINKDNIYCHKKHHTEILYLKTQRSHKNHRLIYLYDIVIDNPIYCDYGYRAIQTSFLFQFRGCFEDKLFPMVKFQKYINYILHKGRSAQVTLLINNFFLFVS